MSAYTLTSEQKTRLTNYIPAYKEWLNSEDGKNNVTEHRDHERFLRELLNPKKMATLTENDFREIFKTLWASRLWTNKDWYIDEKLLKPNGMETIRKGLESLLYGQGDIVNKYNKFRLDVSGFGPSSISEILNFIFPETYCLWNEKPKTVLPFLNLDLLPEKFFKYQINSGEDYLQCINALETIKNELVQFGIRDFIDLDIFFWFLFDKVIPNEKEIEKEVVIVKSETENKVVHKISINSHEGAEYYLLELGRMLGFLPYTVDKNVVFENKNLEEVAIMQDVPPFAAERVMNTVKEIDVIWFDNNENPVFCFEVEHTTDIVHGLERLLQLQHQHAKFFIVAREEKRAKFRDLVANRYPYRSMQNRFKFISYDELARFYETALPFYKQKVELLGGE